MNDSVISARRLGKTIGRKEILRDLSVEVAPGNVVGVIGKNGAGKTTLLEILLGFSPPTTGSSALFGYDSFSLPAAIKGRIGFVPQQDELVDQITGAQQLSLTASLHRHWDRELTAALSKNWEIPLDRPIQTLSAGERQKLSALLALGHQPQLLVLDEPVASLDPISRRQFLRQILEIAAAPTRTVLFSTHIVSDLERVANLLWIVRDGTVVWQGELDVLKESFVRLNIHARQTLPTSLDIANALSLRAEGSRATAVVSHWEDAQAQSLAQRLNADVEVERLTLEDIFVELHS